MSCDHPGALSLTRNAALPGTDGREFAAEIQWCPICGAFRALGDLPKAAQTWNLPSSPQVMKRISPGEVQELEVYSSLEDGLIRIDAGAGRNFYFGLPMAFTLVVGLQAAIDRLAPEQTPVPQIVSYADGRVAVTVAGRTATMTEDQARAFIKTLETALAFAGIDKTTAN